MSASTLATLQRALRSSQDVRSFLQGFCAEVLVFDCCDSTEEVNAVSRLASDEISGVCLIDGPEITISFPENARECNRQLAGLSYVRRGGEAISVFALRTHKDCCTAIVAANGRPMFVRLKTGLPDVFFLGGPPLPDLDSPMSREYEVKEYYDRLLPVILFLRHCFEESCWHNPNPTARLILDDPLLTPRYGFLDYSVLLRSMQRRNYGTSIAFIPWNGWRTSRRDAEQLFGNPQLSVCIHGCDHANREFEGRDPAVLRRKASLALHRMRALHERTGAEVEPVMVFPQERYTSAALAALRGQPFLAVVNTICVPIDSGPDDLRIRDFLAPAITRYHGFPIFQRRYPRRLVDFAFDLLLGKPALAVEHHDYFQHGVAPLEDFVGALQRMEPSLSWPDLGSQLAATCLWRHTGSGTTEVRFFTRRFQLRCRAEDGARYLLRKHEPDAGRVVSVLVDGEPVDFGIEGESLTLEMKAEPGEVHEIEIVDRPEGHGATRGFGIRHNARVLVRRALSEFRDNALSRHRGLQRGAQWVADRLNVTGAGYDDTERYESYEQGCTRTDNHPTPTDSPAD